MLDRNVGNLANFRAMPLLETYEAVYYEHKRDKDTGKMAYDTIGASFQYADGTTDSYVKRGFDEERVQKLTRFFGLEAHYRIFVTDPRLPFKPQDKIKIGDDVKKIVKVLPLMNTNDTLRMYNLSPHLVRQMAAKLIYME